jgi:hypothetical protein
MRFTRVHIAFTTQQRLHLQSPLLPPVGVQRINACTGPVVSLSLTTSPITTSTAFDHRTISLAEPRHRLRCSIWVDLDSPIRSGLKRAKTRKKDLNPDQPASKWHVDSDWRSCYIFQMWYFLYPTHWCRVSLTTVIISWCPQPWRM